MCAVLQRAHRHGCGGRYALVQLGVARSRDLCVTHALHGTHLLIQTPRTKLCRKQPAATTFALAYTYRLTAAQVLQQVLPTPALWAQKCRHRQMLHRNGLQQRQLTTLRMHAQAQPSSSSRSMSVHREFYASQRNVRGCVWNITNRGPQRAAPTRSLRIHTGQMQRESGSLLGRNAAHLQIEDAQQRPCSGAKEQR